MKIQPKLPQYQQQNKNNKDNNRNNQNFTGGFDVALRWLDTNQAWGANIVDLSSMVIPRTAVDTINRGPAAGMETGRRESMGTINHASVGVYGTVAGFALAHLLNKRYDVKAHKIFADDQTIDILSRYWNEARATSNEPAQYVRAFTDKVANNIQFFNPSRNAETGLVKLTDAKEVFSKTLADGILNASEGTITKEFKELLRNIALEDTGAETKVILEGFSKKANNSLNTLIGNICNLGKTFMKEKVDETFRVSSGENVFIKALKSLNLKRSIAGLGIATAIGMSTQPINMYLTKKKTGSDGFVGV